jgi:hypothetical protein
VPIRKKPLINVKIYEEARKKCYLKPCKHCPSHNYEPDPESIDVKNDDSCPWEEKVFLCDWRRRGICTGIAKYISGLEPWKEKNL